jgi:glucose 1-dehydrogenase
MIDLNGKVALVTGAARGIGRGIALCLARQGANVIVNDLPPKDDADIADAQGTVDEITALGQEAIALYADVSDRTQIQSLFEQGIAQFGQMDIVVANAALSIREPVIDAKWEGVLRTIEVTQFGVFHTCQAAAQHMVERGEGGKIIIIGSVLSQIPFRTSAAYNMSKAAVNHLGRTLANELSAHRINVNTINPGYIDTPGERKYATEEEIAEAATQLPWGRLGTPEDIGDAVAFLASSNADYITGSSLNVDGGYIIGMGGPVGHTK